MKANEKQVCMNEKAMELFNDAKSEAFECGTSDPIRLRYCNAVVYATKNYFILRSYWTTVAVIHRNSGEAADVLRGVYGYTATSAQHIRKFFQDYLAVKVYTWRYVD